MYGLRCEDCGEVRWSILGRAADGAACPACGAPMIEERRRPGRHPAAAADDAERRDVGRFIPPPTGGELRVG
jgi:ribosomal protein S27E